MNVFTFSDEILKRLEERKNIYAKTIVCGSVPDMETYRRIVGHIIGLEEGQALIKQFIKDVEKPY